MGNPRSDKTKRKGESELFSFEVVGNGVRYFQGALIKAIYPPPLFLLCILSRT